jgi:hypothetical protein
MFKKYRFQKKYVVFLTVTPLLLATSLFYVDCPISDGTGTIESLPVMEDVKVLDYSTRAKTITTDACGLYRLYPYDVLISLVNESVEDAQGWLKLILRDTLVDRVIDEQYVEIDIPGLTALDAKYTVWFGHSLGSNTGTIETSGQLEIDVEVVVGDVPCLVDDGTGKVPLNTMLFINYLRDTFDNIVRVEQAYNPPNVIDWEDFTWFDQ